MIDDVKKNLSDSKLINKSIDKKVKLVNEPDYLPHNKAMIMTESAKKFKFLNCMSNDLDE
jgi:hypothetical protein